MAFIADSRIAAEAAAAAADMVERARRRFGVALDGSDASIREVESLLQQLHLHARAGRPVDAQVFDDAKGLGSYVGEVFRRHHGAEWGVVSLGDDSYPGMRSTRREQLFWPWRRAYNRIVNGPSENVWHYYQLLVERAGGTLAPIDEGPPSSFAPPTMRFTARTPGAPPGRVQPADAEPARDAPPMPVRRRWWKFW